MNPDDIQARLELAVRIAQEAGGQTLRHFRSGKLVVESKGDGSPVTEADRQAETLLRERIQAAYPQDAILGEEFGPTEGSSGYQWVLDPIDGTKSFVHGVPLYTTLVAVLHDQQPLLGVIHAPALGETVYAACGSGCWYTGDPSESPRPARVSQMSSLSEGLLLTSEVASFGTRQAADAMEVYLSLQSRARLCRTWGDAYGYMMVATGRAEVMIDPALSLWDAAALKPILEEAGGRFTDWQGEATVHSGDAIGSNGLVADEVLALTRGR